MSILRDSKRVVVKVGTSTLTHKTGMLNIRRVECLVKTLSDLKNAGKEIILVTSGAIGVGAGKLSLKQRPADIPGKQACAALGQCELMYIYDKYFSEYNHNVAQVLLTRDVIEDAHRKQNVVNTFERLFALSALPIVNENDTVAIDELTEGANHRYGDNDTLSAIVAQLVEADLLIILSDIDGLYDGDPKENPKASLIERVYRLDERVMSLGGGKGSEFGTGGMAAKLNAAGICMNAGIPMIICNGKDPHNLYRLLDGEAMGTLFQA